MKIIKEELQMKIYINNKLKKNIKYYIIYPKGEEQNE